jgi:hypothetical protein
MCGWVLLECETWIVYVGLWICTSGGKLLACAPMAGHSVGEDFHIPDERLRCMVLILEILKRGNLDVRAL